MSRRLRHFEPGNLVEVTTRTLQAIHLLTPSVSVNELILGVVGRMQAKYGLEIQLLVFLSNHYHMLCRPKDPQHLARAICYLNSNLARELGRLHGFREKVWGRRYQAIPVSDEPEAQIARAHYLLSHGCKEGFVLTPGDWPGVHCVHALLEGRPLRGIWHDRTREFVARRRGIAFDEQTFSTEYTVTLSPIPCWEHLSSEEYRSRVADLVQHIEADARRRQAETGRPPLGAEFIRRQNPLHRPARSKRAPAPMVHAACRAVRNAMISAYRLFLAAYRSASRKLREGVRSVEFPRYCFPPSLPFSAGP